MEREEFVKKYFPQYVQDYRPPTGIRLVKSASGGMHVQMSTKGSIQSQVTKRNNRINEAYERYKSDHARQLEFDRKATEPTLI